MKTIDINQQQKISYCVSLDLRDEQIKINLNKVKKRFEPSKEFINEPIAVVAFAPSLKETWEKLKDFKYIMTCSGAHKFLIEKGIVPTWHVDLEPREHKIKMLGKPHRDVEYLIASTVHPRYLDQLEGYNVKLWHIFANENEGTNVLPRGEWMVTGGCIHNLGKVETEDGQKTIKWVVDNKYNGKVLSLNNKGEFVWQKILRHLVKDNNNPRKEWVRLITSKSKFQQKLICTSDHRCAVIDDVLSPSIYYLRADKTKNKYAVRLPIYQKHGNKQAPLYNQEQMSIMFGVLFGDGDITKSGNFRTLHGHKQKEYLELEHSIFGGTISEHKSGFSKNTLYRVVTRATEQTKLLRTLLYPNNGKKTVKNVLQYLDEKSLAFWYMDDGCLQVPKPVNGHPGRNPFATFCTQGFGEEDNKLLVKYFKEKWGIICVTFSYSRKNGKREFMLRFSVEGSNILFKLIAKYIPECMQYKIPEKFRVPFTYKFNNKALDYAASYISDVRTLSESKRKSSKLYDLEVEHTHSFVVNRTVVHNSSVGLRCMTLARLLGFTDLHIFGMDGNIREDGSHTTTHPNAPKEKFETEYKGKKYLTTPSILHCAKETFRELDQMPDVKATFYGEGLVQDMAKDYTPAPKRGSDVAYNKPKLISEEYKELNWKLHQDVPTYGMGGAKHADTVLKLSKANNTTSILDYGCGKGMLAKSLPFPIWEYDPAIPEKSASPKPADIVVATDVLEHIELDKLQFVLDDLRRCTKQVAYLVISTRKAVKTYANGQNTHSIVQGKDWWGKKLKKHFDIGTIIEKEKECELHIVVAPKKIIQPDTTTVEKNGTKVKFYTPNETTKWRAETLFTKEPATIEWIEQMKEGEVMYDVGANIGSYSVLAGVKGVKVYSFEPEAENYSLLVKNMQLNGIEPNAYCLAISDEEKMGTLYAGQTGVGGACHSFNEKVGHNLAPRETKFTQGCFGVPLDRMVEDGLPHPQHLKIDVDGLEYKVIKGATNILANGLKSILVEVNPGLPQHIEMVDYLCGLGFEYDVNQVERAKRKEGTFKGLAEYVFTKTKNKEHSVADKVTDAAMELEPYNHIYIDGVFSSDTYKLIQETLPNIKYEEIEKTRGTKGYPKRFTGKVPEFLSNMLLGGGFKKALLDKFGFTGNNYSEDLLLVRDYEGYAIPPHTDSLSKVITVLIYLPEDNSMKQEGTSIFTPKEKGFICKDGRHYNFKDFDKVKTMPFRSNSMFAFARTDNSFHGVEPCNHIRNVLLYNINKK